MRWSITQLAFMFLRHGTKHSIRDAIWDMFISKDIGTLALSTLLLYSLLLLSSSICSFFFLLASFLGNWLKSLKHFVPRSHIARVAHHPIPRLGECGLKKWRSIVRRGSKWLSRKGIIYVKGCKGNIMLLQRVPWIIGILILRACSLQLIISSVQFSFCSYKSLISLIQFSLVQ